jgi:hypothetical protein
MKKLEDGKDEDIADLFPDYDSLRFVLRLLMCSTLSEKELLKLSQEYVPAVSPASPLRSSSKDAGVEQATFLTKTCQILFAKTLRAALIDWSKELDEKCKNVLQVKRGAAVKLLTDAIQAWQLAPPKSKYTGSMVEYNSVKSKIAKVIKQKKITAIPFALDGESADVKDAQYAYVQAVKDALFVDRDADTDIEEGRTMEEVMWEPSNILEYPSFVVGSREFGPIEFHRVPIKIPIRVEAILGMEFFDNYLVFIDFSEKQIYLTKSKSLNRAF